MENEGSLGVFFFEIFHGLGSKNPVFGFEVGLENGGSEVLLALDVEEIFHLLDEKELFLKIIVDTLDLRFGLVELFVDLL